MTTTYTTEVLGLGQAPLGNSPLGLWQEEVTEANATQFGARYIDPRTKDYAVRDGEILRTSNTKQRVILILTTEVNTSLAIKGITFPAKHDDSTARVVEADVRRALQLLIDDGSMRNLQVRPVTKADGVVGRLGIAVDYVDTESGETETVVP